jgi:hypothetical protein
LLYNFSIELFKINKEEAKRHPNTLESVKYVNHHIIMEFIKVVQRYVSALGHEIVIEDNGYRHFTKNNEVIISELIGNKTNKKLYLLFINSAGVVSEKRIIFEHF